MMVRWMKFAAAFCTAAVLALTATALSTCGGGKAPPSQSSVLSFQPPEQVAGDRQQIEGEMGSPREASLAETLSELADLEAPAGVDEASFGELKSGLHESLLADWMPGDALLAGGGMDPSARMHALVEALESTRFVSTVPGEGGRVDDLELTDNGDGTYTLTWTYKNSGDYNQDGIVDIKDLVPLAAHFGENWEVPMEYPPPPAPPYDGNEDGVVDIKDLTPIAANFFCDVAGYSIEGSEFPEGEFTEIVQVRLPAPEGEMRIHFEMPLTGTGYKYFAVRPFSVDWAMGELSNVVERNFLPVAVAAASPIEGKAPLMVTFTCSDSSDRDGDIVKYEWDFDGDGEYDWERSSGMDTQHRFDVESEYAAVLRVTDDDGGTATDSVVIKVGRNEPPVAVAEVYPAFGNEPLTVVFDCEESSDPDGTIVDYRWDFYSNGVYDWESTMAQTTMHTYEHFGTYTAKLRVMDDKGAVGTDTVSIRVNGAPIARLTAYPLEGKAPLEVHFNAYESVDVDRKIVEYDWDWDGNGTYDYDSGHVPWENHTYNSDGDFTATVRVRDEDGLADTASVIISVAPGDPPTINSVAPIAGLSGYPTTFTASVFGAEPLTYRWNFGGGATPNLVSEESPTVTLGAEGNYDASLTVSCQYGETVFDFTLGVYQPGPGDWAMFGRDIKHSRMSPYVGAQADTIRWTSYIGFLSQSSAAFGADGTVYVGGGNHNVYAIGSGGESYRWGFATDSVVTSSPAIGGDGTVYIGSWDHFLYAINPDGSLQWRSNVGGEVESSPAVADDGTVYIGSNDGNLYAFSPDGTEKWRYDCGWRVFSTPAVDSAYGVVYIGGRDGWIYAITDKGTEGSLKWQRKTEGQIFSSPAIGENGTVYIGSYDGYLYAIYPSGTLKWKYDIGSQVYSSPGIGPYGVLIVGAFDGGIYAIGDNQTEGIPLWDYQTGDRIFSSPAIDAGGNIYVGSESGKVYALDAAGILKWEYDTSDFVFSSPAIGPDGSVVVTSFWGTVYAFGD